MGMLLIPLSGFAQDEEIVEVDLPPLFSDTMTMVMAVCVVLIGLAGVYMIFKALDLMVRVRELKIYDLHGLQSYLDEVEANEGSWWQRFQRRMTDYVPLDKEDEILMDHNYDGIRELDNNLPPWWLYGFYLTIAISVVYMGYHHMSSYGISSTERYELQMEKAEKEVAAYLAKQADQIDETNVTALTDDESLAKGQEIFISLCAACHLDHGGGNAVSVGPNLTDEYWLHGGSITDIFKTIKYGVPEKGMISWRSQIRPSDMHKVASFVFSLKGTNPPDAKEAQGELYVASEDADNVADSEQETEEEAADTDL